MMNSIIQWVLSALLILNLWLMGNKSIWGPITGTIVEIGWVGYTLTTHQYGLVLGMVILVLVNLRNWIKWHTETH